MDGKLLRMWPQILCHSVLIKIVRNTIQERFKKNSAFCLWIKPNHQGTLSHYRNTSSDLTFDLKSLAGIGEMAL